ncbi:hypothetical protein BY996DRAFT_6492184 [Phakopsora pachyrhizi]|nr:hypothetical protein BY996DRAFT_6492184 [Phakopsora pachyrhizi]
MTDQSMLSRNLIEKKSLSDQGKNLKPSSYLPDIDGQNQTDFEDEDYKERIHETGSGQTGGIFIIEQRAHYRSNRDVYEAQIEKKRKEMRRSSSLRTIKAEEGLSSTIKISDRIIMKTNNLSVFNQHLKNQL